MSDDGQMIYDVGVRLTWKVTKGNGYTNHYRGNEKTPYYFTTRAKDIDAINRNPEMIAKMMVLLGLTGKKVYDFHLVKEFYREELSRSFAPKEDDYSKEFGE